MRISDLEKELEEVIKGQQEFARGLSGSDNPQVRQELEKARVREEVLRAVLDRIKGDRLAFVRYRFDKIS